MTTAIGRDDNIRIEGEAKVLRSIAEPPVELTRDKEAIFHWSEEHLTVGTKDGANVISVNQIVTPSAFDEYEINIDAEEIHIGMACDTILDLLNEVDADESIILELNKNTGKFDLRFKDVKYSLAPRDTSSIQDPPKENVDNQLSTWTNKNIFRRANRILGMADDVVTFNFSDGDVTMLARGDSDTAEISLKSSKEDREEADVVYQDDPENFKADFSTKYLEYIPKFTPTGLFEAQFDPENPLVIKANRANNRIPTEIRLSQRL